MDQAEIEALKNQLVHEDYFGFKYIEGKGLCGLRRFLYTTGLCIGLTRWSFEGRYCFENLADAREALDKWDGEGDPSGDWIKYKGRTEYSNPNSKL